MKRDTIVALASGAGRAGVAVIRISGARARDVLIALTGEALPKPRYAERRIFRGKTRDSKNAFAIDDGLALFFPSPHSFTGEDVVELQGHGGAAVVSALIEACVACDDVRLAEPGEFTRRAFENGKLDLAQAEGLADLIDAETDAQRAQALRQMQGALSAVYEDWRARLIGAMALLEAEIDFPDEDLPGGLADRVGPVVDALAAEMEAHLNDAHRGERVRDGYRIAILGAPNAGKSSLLNALARREAAIVSDIPGTTRDVVEVRLVLGGYPVWIADTAGLREAADAIEAEGVRRALARAEEADLRLGLVDGQGSAEDAQAIARRLQPGGDILVSTRRDIPHGAAFEETQIIYEDLGLDQPAWISTKTGEGLADLEAEIIRRVQADLGTREAPALTRVRHRQLVEAAARDLRRDRPALPELWAEDLRRAADSLGRLTGRIDVEDVLGEIFASFCIGK